MTQKTDEDLNAIPVDSDLAKAFEIDILDYQGNKTSFLQVITTTQAQVLVVVFVRHFFCGSCQQYSAQLASSFESILSSPQGSNIDVRIIGCGDYLPIDKYSEMTGFPKDKIFANPSRTLYRALGMNIETHAATPSNEQPKSYLKKSMAANIASSIMKALSHPSLIGKQGNTYQLGGDFVFIPNEKKCVFAHRMKHTEDHVEVADLFAAAQSVLPIAAEADVAEPT